MDANEATRIVFSRIQNLDPEHAPKIMGLLLLQEHGEEEMIRLAFGPESLLRSLVLKAWKQLGLVPDPSSSAPCKPFGGGSSASPFLLRQNSASRLSSRGLPSPLAVSSPSLWRSNSSSGCNGLNGSSDEFQNSDELISPGNVRASPFYGVGGGGGDLIDEFHRSDQLSFLGDAAAVSDYSHPFSFASKHGGDGFQPDIECRSPSSGDCTLFPYGVGLGVDGHYHRRSFSAAELGLGDPAAGFGWRPCLYFARGYCKNGTACRFLHGLPEEAVVGGTKMDTVLEQQCQELLLRSKSQRIDGASQLAASAFPYSQTGSVPPSPSSSSNSLSFLLQQQLQNEGQRATAVAAAAALMLGGDDTHKFVCRSRFERNDLMANPGSRQIYLTFPADSTFSEEDVSNYFRLLAIICSVCSIYGPVHDVRIPYQQKRMFGFVTFVYPETVKLILAKGNPHFVCDSRVLVKPYKEKGKVPDKYRHSSLLILINNIFFFYDITGARRLYNGSSQELLLRRKLLEQQQQAAELQRAIELQGSRFMNLQLNLTKRGLSNSPAIAATQSLSDVDSSNASSSSSSSHEGSPTEEKSLSTVAPEEKLNTSDGLLQQKADKEESAGEPNHKEDSDFQPSRFSGQGEIGM
ncbi:hypothetical protein B296_00018996 [Ensete ventricosum]|uniref:C3H1-type domain-containing protein n=1 Tax=Ensete ventricosum TaxID=4639 RepID=A0A427B369_ENSVE|nr:hypothetical protein B296_00018996 [Ensete ventricosum]